MKGHRLHGIWTIHVLVNGRVVTVASFDEAERMGGV